MSIDKLKETLIYFIFKRKRVIGRTKLLKLIYLADVLAYDRLGRTITGVNYIAYDHGPWTPDLYKALDSTPEIREKVGWTSLGDIQYDYAGAVPEYRVRDLPDEELQIVEEVNNKWGHVPLRQILDYVYRSPPFVGTPFGESVDFSKVKRAGAAEQG